MKKITIDKSLVLICEYNYRKGFKDALSLIKKYGFKDGFKVVKESLKIGIREARKKFVLK